MVCTLSFSTTRFIFDASHSTASYRDMVSSKYLGKGDSEGIKSTLTFTRTTLAVTWEVQSIWGKFQWSVMSVSALGEG